MLLTDIKTAFAVAALNNIAAATLNRAFMKKR